MIIGDDECEDGSLSFHWSPSVHRDLKRGIVATLNAIGAV